MTEIFTFLNFGKEEEEKRNIEVSKIENCGNLKTQMSNTTQGFVIGKGYPFRLSVI